MVQSVKQCAGCGAQMGARARVCPRCGRGSLFGELIWIAVLGILLLGIGLVSGLVPIERIPGFVRSKPVDEGTLHQVKAKITAHLSTGRLKGRVAAKVRTVGPAETTLTNARCGGTDTEVVRLQVSYSSHADSHTHSSLSCRQPRETSASGVTIPADTISH
jgi:hypothetical protein